MECTHYARWVAGFKGVQVQGTHVGAREGREGKLGGSERFGAMHYVRGGGLTTEYLMCAPPRGIHVPPLLSPLLASRLLTRVW